MIPGIGERSIKSNYRRSQTLNYRDGVPVPRPESASQSAILARDSFFPPDHLLEHREQSLECHPFPVGGSESLPVPRPVLLPRYVVYDRLQLGFEGYYRDSCSGWGFSDNLLRVVKVYYFLEDDTMTVVEPVIPNSGLPQGKLIQRHRFEKEDGQHWHWKDLNVAMDLRVYGRTFRLSSCDKWTREFLTSAGIVVNPPEEPPVRSSGGAKEVEEDLQRRSKSAPIRKYRLKQFLEHDGKILKFKCLWDRSTDTSALYHDDRNQCYALLYFLVDDTIQISDPDSSPRRANPSRRTVNDSVLVKRQRVPKEPRPPLATPADAEALEYYGVEDLRLGCAITIHGRRFILLDCDDFTKEFYRHTFNIVDFQAVHIDSF